MTIQEQLNAANRVIKILVAELITLREDKTLLDALEKNRLSLYTLCDQWGCGRYQTQGTGNTAREAIAKVMKETPCHNTLPQNP